MPLGGTNEALVLETHVRRVSHETRKSKTDGITIRRDTQALHFTLHYIGLVL
jgi:hypothetical protein